MASGEMTRPEFVTFLSDFLAVMKALACPYKVVRYQS
jgi:hypothetical protein